MKGTDSHWTHDPKNWIIEEPTDHPCKVKVTQCVNGRIENVSIQTRHEPFPTVKIDEWGRYDEVKCRKCGKVLSVI